MLHVSELTKRYGRLVALDEVAFSIRPGEVLGLIGPNGSGKTTLFECVAGVLPADRGRVEYDGRAIAPADRSSVLFYLPDAIAPWPSQTVRWALDFTAGFFAFSVLRSEFSVRTENVRTKNDRTKNSERRTQNVMDLSDRLDLGPLLNMRIGELSKGQRKRALLAIGLLMPQPLLLADEPFEGLDLRQSRDVAATLRHYAREGRTLFLSIHQIGDAERACDRFVLLSGGRVRGEGTIDELSRVAAKETRDLEEVFLALT